MLRKQCRRVTTAVVGNEQKALGPNQQSRCIPVRQQQTRHRPKFPCLECPLFLASKRQCPLTGTCPVLLHQRVVFFSSTSSSTNDRLHNGYTCFDCGRDFIRKDVLSTLRCPHCHRLQSRHHLALNHFELLADGRLTFNPDQSLIRRNFLRRQKMLHPDQFASLSAEDAARASDWSAHINRAHQTLKNDLSRAIYLVTIHITVVNLIYDMI